ncbi:GNAT family N-acetyltransferase [Pontivivens insulae]|uniref:GNAT family N-acetyltransferase n=1 Tax=Pontivivens insulae TaxID=1639689 RepID=UPI000D5542F6|nr:GNAT family N-acetyltransferase [Pontivivens insulae]
MIRLATQDDLAAIQTLHLESWQHTYRTLMPPTFLAEEAPRYLARKWQVLPTGTVLVAEDDTGLLGFTAIDDADPAYLDALHVRRSAQGGGLGASLIVAAFRAVAARGVRGAWLYILEGNDDAQRFYQRLGAVETWRGPDPDHGAGITAIRLDWPDLSIMLQQHGSKQAD